MKLVVGLGNLGKQYSHTRHNIGFGIVDRLAARAEVSFKKSWRFPAHLVTIEIASESVLLVKPQTFMNRSGLAIGPLLKKKGVSLDNLIVVADDVLFPVGQLRIRKKGSAGGHNGLKSIIESIGSDCFTRLRVGVGEKSEHIDLIKHVLGTFPSSEREQVDHAIDRAADAVVCIVEDGLDQAMNTFN